MQHTITDSTVGFIVQWEGFKSHTCYDATGHVWTDWLRPHECSVKQYGYNSRKKVEERQIIEN